MAPKQTSYRDEIEIAALKAFEGLSAADARNFDRDLARRLAPSLWSDTAQSDFVDSLVVIVSKARAYAASADRFKNDILTKAADRIRFINANREALIEAWIAETGLLPSESTLVKTVTDGADGVIKTRVHIERRGTDGAAAAGVARSALCRVSSEARDLLHAQLIARSGLDEMESL